MRVYYQDSWCTIYHGDCRSILPMLTYDCMVTDPPYGTGRVIGGSEEGVFYAKREQESWDVWDLWWLKTTMPTIFFGPNSRQDEIKELCQGMLRYVKTNPRPLAPLFEVIGVTHLAIQDSWIGYNRRDNLHPYGKPLGLLIWAMELCIEPQWTLVDPFMGSGTTLRAAKDLGRKAIGIEIEERWCEVAANRLRQEVLWSPPAA